MGKFKEADDRRLRKKVCLRCKTVNAFGATRCRKCRSTELRLKHKDKKR